MRVLLITGSFPPNECGVGDYCEQLAIALGSRPELTVGVLTLGVVGRLPPEKISLLEIDTDWSFFQIPKIIQAIRKWNPDIVHFQYPCQGFRGRAPSLIPLICRFIGLTVVQTWHEAYKWVEWQIFILQLLGAAGLVFVRPNYCNLLPSMYRWLLCFYRKAYINNAAALSAGQRDPYLQKLQRKNYLSVYKRLIVFFGFVYSSKGIESLFEIANPVTDKLIIAGGIKDEIYMRSLIKLAVFSGWSPDQILFTGFLPADEACQLLSIADAVVLPFKNGGGEWNTSMHSALAQGTLVITTSLNPSGDDPQRNLYTAPLLAIEEMKFALDRLAGRRIQPPKNDDVWKTIAVNHINFYKELFPSFAIKHT